MANKTMVTFKRGLVENLPVDVSNGAIYITTDERSMYVDIDGKRIRIGDFQEFATLAELRANTNPSTTALYYVTELNCLAKWNGTEYVQINLDTGATSVEVTGSGNALDGVTYDPATRKLTFTRTKTFTTADDVDAQIDAKVGELKLGDATFATVKAYVDKKTDGIATDAAIETLSGRVTTAEGKLDTLIGEDSGKSARSIANEELAKQLIPEGAKESLDTLAEIAAWIQAHPDDATAMNKAISDLTSLVGTLPTDAESATVAAYIKEYADDAVAALSVRITELETDSHTHANKTVLDGVTAEKVAAWDEAEQNAKEYTNSALEWGTF